MKINYLKVGYKRKDAAFRFSRLFRLFDGPQLSHKEAIKGSFDLDQRRTESDAEEGARVGGRQNVLAQAYKNVQRRAKLNGQ